MLLILFTWYNKYKIPYIIYYSFVIKLKKKTKVGSLEFERNFVRFSRQVHYVEISL